MENDLLKTHSKSLPDLLIIENPNIESRKGSLTPNVSIDKFQYKNWNFPLTLPPIFKEKITKLQIIECIIKKHVGYKIKITCENDLNWEIIRRYQYREFRQLHINIKSVYKGKLPTFPEKNFFSNMSQKNIQERFISNQNY
eukprot:gene5297-8915_t